MEKGKYINHLIKAPIHMSTEDPDPRNMLDFIAGKELGVDLGVMLVPIVAPTSTPQPHKHNFHQFLCFLGGDPNNINEYGAEVEMSLGDEGEKHIITTPTIVHITPGLLHCPLVYKKVNKPVYQLDIFLASQYERV